MRVVTEQGDGEHAMRWRELGSVPVECTPFSQQYQPVKRSVHSRFSRLADLPSRHTPWKVEVPITADFVVLRPRIVMLLTSRTDVPRPVNTGMP